MRVKEASTSHRGRVVVSTTWYSSSVCSPVRSLSTCRIAIRFSSLAQDRRRHERGLNVGGAAARAKNVPVGPAAAEISADRPLNLLVGGCRILVQKRPQAHDLAWRAKAALEGILLHKRLLN